MKGTKESHFIKLSQRLMEKLQEILKTLYTKRIATQCTFIK